MFMFAFITYCRLWLVHWSSIGHLTECAQADGHFYLHDYISTGSRRNLAASKLTSGLSISYLFDWQKLLSQVTYYFLLVGAQEKEIRETELPESRQMLHHHHLALSRYEGLYGRVFCTTYEYREAT